MNDFHPKPYFDFWSGSCHMVEDHYDWETMKWKEVIVHVPYTRDRHGNSVKNTGTGYLRLKSDRLWAASQVVEHLAGLDLSVPNEGLPMSDPAWIKCHCEEWWCTIHNMHVFECPCPPVDKWKTDPYGFDEEEE